jgi:hypothetical protein
MSVISGITVISGIPVILRHDLSRLFREESLSLNKDTIMYQIAVILRHEGSLLSRYCKLCCIFKTLSMPAIAGFYYSAYSCILPTGNFSFHKKLHR